MVREKVHKTHVNVEIAMTFTEWGQLHNKKGDTYEIQVSK